MNKLLAIGSIVLTVFSVSQALASMRANLREQQEREAMAADLRAIRAMLDRRRRSASGRNVLR